MLDLALLRRDPNHLRRMASRRPGGGAFVDRILELDARLRAARLQTETLKSVKNGLTQQISRATDRAEAATRLRPQIAEIEERIAEASASLPSLEQQIDAILAEVPNVLDDSVPDGSDEAGQRRRAQRRRAALVRIPSRGRTWELEPNVSTSSTSSARPSSPVRGSRSSARQGRAALTRDRELLLVACGATRLHGDRTAVFG